MLYVQPMTDEERLAQVNDFFQRFCADMGLPPPAPWTAEQEAAHQRRMRESDAKVAAMIARQQAREAS